MNYLDCAATSVKKPECVYTAADHALRHASANPGRAGHRLSLTAGAIVKEARLLCSRLLNAETADSIVFCSNGSDALNLALHGIMKDGGHVVTSSMEHNSVARPLEYLKTQGVSVTKVNSDINTGVSVLEIENAIREDTRLVVINHISNVTGTVNDIEKIGSICRKNNVLFLVDAAQSAGARKIDVQKMKIDLLAFPGHKSLFGPQGTGGLYVGQHVDLEPLKQGGTGSRSELLFQPLERPDRYESGTLNVAGIAGLREGIRYILETGYETIDTREKFLVQTMINELRALDGITIYAPEDSYDRGAVFSIRIKHYEPQEIAMILDEVFDVAVRAGLHCAPDAHRSIGTLDAGGTVRISVNYLTSDEEIHTCIEGIRQIVKETI